MSSRQQYQEAARRKQREREDNKVLQEFSRSTRVKVSLTPNRFATYFGVAFFTTIIPSYLFHSVRGLDFEGFTMLLYVIVCAGAAYLLSQAYHNMYARTFARLKKINDKDFVLKAGTEPEEKQRLENAKDVLTQQSALGQALAITNVVYLAVSLLFSFYVLSSADVRLNYVLSLPAAAAACFYLSKTKSKSD